MWLLMTEELRYRKVKSFIDKIAPGTVTSSVLASGNYIGSKAYVKIIHFHKKFKLVKYNSNDQLLRPPIEQTQVPQGEGRSPGRSHWLARLRWRSGYRLVSGDYSVAAAGTPTP